MKEMVKTVPGHFPQRLRSLALFKELIGFRYNNRETEVCGFGAENPKGCYMVDG